MIAHLPIEALEVFVLLTFCLSGQTGLFICCLGFVFVFSLVAWFLSQKEGPLHYLMCEGKTISIFPTLISISRRDDLRDKICH